MLLPPALALPLRPYADTIVVVGVSGGADSVALLRALVLVGARPVVGHIDHALREDSAADAEWVAKLAQSLNVPFRSVRVDVATVARKRGWNLEDAARRLRYDFLARTAKDCGAEAILTAHTRRDQAETVLLQLLRGEGVLHGIPAERGHIRRPWLGVSRAELEAFLQRLGQGWREDSTNLDTTYSRAWIRHEVMPLLQSRFEAAEETIARIAATQREDETALTALAQAITPHAPLSTQPRAILRRYVRQQLQGAGLTYHQEHLNRLTTALQKGQTEHATLPAGQEVTATGERLYLEPLTWPQPDFDYPAHWQRRTRQNGDRIRLSAGTRKLSDVLTDAHIPRAERDRITLLVCGDAVQWVGTSPPFWAVGAREQTSAHDPHDLGMRRALELAQAAADAGEVPVGAVVVTAAGDIVGEGRNSSRKDGDMTRHAELAALRAAADTLGTPYLTDCTLLVTLEPCPMCLGAALEARIGHIVYGAKNPKAGALGGVADLLAHHWGVRPTVTGGLYAHAAAQLLRRSFQEWREQR